jgi:hypothetical protein
VVGLAPCRLLKPYILGYPGGLPGPLDGGRRVRLVGLDSVPAVHWVLHPSPLWYWWHSPVLRPIMGHGIPMWHQTWWLGGVLLATCHETNTQSLSHETCFPHHSKHPTCRTWKVEDLNNTMPGLKLGWEQLFVTT